MSIEADAASEVMESASEVIESASEVTDTASIETDAASEVMESASEVTDAASEVMESASIETDAASEATRVQSAPPGAGPIRVCVSSELWAIAGREVASTREKGGIMRHPRSLRCVVLGVGLVGLSGAVAAPAAAGTAPRIAWLANDPTNTYDNATLAGVQQVAASYGGTVTPMYAEFDAGTQLSQCLAAVGSGLYDALVVEADDPVGIEKCVKAAHAAGIPVAAADLPIGKDQTTVAPQVTGEVAACFIPASTFGGGIVEIVPEVCNGLDACNILYLAGDETFPLDEYGVAGVAQVAATNPSVHLVLEAQASYDTTTAYQVTTAALAAHPEINVVIASGDQMALGAEQAGKAAHQPLRIVGAGAGESAIDAVQKGRWFATYDALPRTEGVLATTLLVEALQDPHVQPTGVDPVVARGLPDWWTQATLAQYPGFVPEWPGP